MERKGLSRPLKNWGKGVVVDFWDGSMGNFVWYLC